MKTLDNYAAEQEEYWNSLGYTCAELAQICEDFPEWMEIYYL